MYDSNVKSRLGKANGILHRSQNSLSGRIGKKNVSAIKNRLGKNNRLGASLVPQTQGNQINKIRTKIQARSISDSDIRNKIIAKKRQNITDARDRLAEIAKSEDARVKLNKLKTDQPSNVMNSSQLQVMAKSIAIKKTIKNEVRHHGQSVVANQNSQNGASHIQRAGHSGRTQMKGGALTRTVTGNSKPFSASTRPLVKKVNVARQASSLGAMNSDRYHPLQNNPNVVTIRNENAANARRPQNNRSSHTQMQDSYSQPEYGPMYQIQRPQEPTQTASSYGTYEGIPVWAHQQPVQFREEIRPPQLRITTANNYMDYYQAPTQRYEEQVATSYQPVPVRGSLAPRRYDTFEEYTPSIPKKQVLSSEIISRLDKPQIPGRNGFKIVVTNLHHVVTLEDVEELFGNIGPIKSARLIRGGVAEIIFVHKEDACRAVEVYHNRQLDGLPMMVSVVTGKNDISVGRPQNGSLPTSYRPVPSFRASPPRRNPAPFLSQATNRITTKSVLRAAGGGSSVHDSSQLYSKRAHQLDVAPDISTIHQALFCGKGNAPLSNQQFYVKLPKPALRGMK